MAFTSLWNAAYEQDPVGSDKAGVGASIFRFLKTAVREIIGVEHRFSLTESAYHGWHKAGSAVAFCGPSLPTTRIDGTAFALVTDAEPTRDNGVLAVLTADVGTVRAGLYMRLSSESANTEHPYWRRVSDLDFIAELTKDAGVSIEGVVHTDGQVSSAGKFKLNGLKDGQTDDAASPDQTGPNSIAGDLAVGRAVVVGGSEQRTDGISLEAAGATGVKTRFVRFSSFSAPSSPVDGDMWVEGS